jgi:hypothetical protein
VGAYKKRKVRGRRVDAHRLIWELANGPIPEGYIVHHRDHDKLNNDLSNLELMTHQQHAEHHNQKHPRIKTCEVCGTEYEPSPTKRQRSKTCSWECRNAMIAQKAREREAAKRAS